MSKMDDIKQAAVQLSKQELAELVAWLEELEEQRFDEQIERDEKAGKLDKLAEKWRADHAAGMHTDLEPPRRSGRR